MLERPPRLRRSTAEFRSASRAMFAAGFATFALLYFVQPLMPVFSAQFGLSPAESSLSLSISTGALAVGMLASSAISERVGRKPVMLVSLLASALLVLASAATTRWASFLALRALAGLTLSGLPAVAMAYLAEEVEPASIGLAMGLYIAGSGLGGMGGRLFASLLVDLGSWRTAVAAIGCLGIASAWVVRRGLPPSAHFRAEALTAARLLAAFGDHLRDSELRWLYAEGFLLLGSFVSVYNYAGYRLLAPPFEVSQSALGLIFCVYLVGIVSAGWLSSVAGRIGRRRMMWPMVLVVLAGVLVSLFDSIAAIVVGMALVTLGFFGGHSIASAWVAQRAAHSRAQASSLYLFSYYLGSSTIGSVTGLFWSRWRWPGVVCFLVVLLLFGLVVALRLLAMPAKPAARA